jgi:hypothetical protein
MTQYLLSVYPSDADWNDVDPAEMQKSFEQVDVFNAELQASGNWVFAGGLHPASTATVVKVDNGDTVVTDGPFVETKEQLGGFWIVEAADLDAALALARRATAACKAPVEVRPFQDV